MRWGLGGWEGGEEAGQGEEGIVCKGNCKMFNKGKERLQIFHWRVKESIISILTTGNNVSTVVTQRSVCF